MLVSPSGGEGSGAIIGSTKERALPAKRRQRGLGGAVSTLVNLWHCGLDVSAYLALGQQIEVGEHACLGCGRRLGGWSGSWHWVRGPGTGRLWIRRTRCSRCRRSHALLPDFLLERRLDEVQVIGPALALSINELAHRGSL